MPSPHGTWRSTYEAHGQPRAGVAMARFSLQSAIYQLCVNVRKCISGYLTEGSMARDEAPVMAVRTSGSGPDLVLFHGGMGCWQHWVRNIGPLSDHFNVYALDHPSYGASASVPRETTGAAYLELVHR